MIRRLVTQSCMPVPGYSGFYPGKLNGESVEYATSPMTKLNKPRVEAAIPGYRGHITGKVMYHGATFGANNRAASEKKDHREVERRPGDGVKGAPSKRGYPIQGRAAIA